MSVKAAKSDKGRQIQGSPAWMAPEMVQGGEVTVKTDVYSFAIILWEMLTRKIPYEHCSIFQVGHIVVELLPFHCVCDKENIDVNHS